MTNPARAWLAEFRLMNLNLRRPLDGRPLYSYQVTQSEYQQLAELLRKKPKTLTHSAYLNDWAACFCLYVAENFRREYDSNCGWSWVFWSIKTGHFVKHIFQIQSAFYRPA
jgi:hypothetical protein